MKGAKAMATKREELAAWRKLKKTYPNTYATINLDYEIYSDGEDLITYRAYVGEDFNCWGGPSDSPMEAVDNLIKRIGGDDRG
jgi:hypothetical protein